MPDRLILAKEAPQTNATNSSTCHGGMPVSHTANVKRQTAPAFYASRFFDRVRSLGRFFNRRVRKRYRRKISVLFAEADGRGLHSRQKHRALEISRNIE